MKFPGYIKQENRGTKDGYIAFLVIETKNKRLNLCSLYEPYRDHLRLPGFLRQGPIPDIGENFGTGEARTERQNLLIPGAVGIE